MHSRSFTLHVSILHAATQALQCTHKIIFDGKKELSIDYVNEKGEVISTMKPDGQDMSDVGMAGSLVKILGIERAEQLLGSSYRNTDLYSAQTLKDVLNLSDDQIARIRRSGSLAGIKLTNSQKQSLLGEALMNKAGASWEAGKGWQNTSNIAMTIVNGQVAGNIMAEVRNGKYLYSTVNATVYRNPDSWKSVSSEDGQSWKGNTEYYGRDYILYEKQGINYDGYDSLLLGKYQTVDNLTGNDDKHNRNQAYYDEARQTWIQGNTVNSSFNMGYYTDWRGTSCFENKVLVLNNTSTIGGTMIGNFGCEYNLYTDRWLAHDNSKKDDTNNWITTTFVEGGKRFSTQYSDGCFVTTRENQRRLLEKLQKWGLAGGYQITGTIVGQKYKKYNGVK